MEAFVKHAAHLRSLAIAGLAFFALAGPAAAGPVTILPSTLAPEFEAVIVEDYGRREAGYLQRRVDRAVEHALVRAGATPAQGAALRIETTIVSARPNKPTLQQLSDLPGLDYMRSIGTGGAELTAVLRGADGATVGEVRHRYYSYDLRYVYANTTWHDAERAISGFARKLAREYARISN
jgi:hypothetical protein